MLNEADQCPHCRSTKVSCIDSRREAYGRRRRRECAQCRARWTTVEVRADRIDGLLHAHEKVTFAVAEIVSLARGIDETWNSALGTAHEPAADGSPPPDIPWRS